MLINKIQRSMEMTLEGVDTLNVSLILEASGEFEKGVAELKKNLEGFIRVCKPFDELVLMANGMNDGLESLNKLDLNDVSDEYSFTDHYKMQSADLRGDNYLNPEWYVSTVAMEYPQYVSAIRDSILEIAKWLEQHPQVFSVGKNGIVFTKDLQGVIANTDLKINDFAQSGDEIVALMSGINDSTSEKTELKAHYASVWKKEGLEPDKENEEWDKFVAGFDAIRQGAQPAFDNAVKAIKGVKPPEEIKTSSKKSGGILKSVLGAIFGGGGKSKEGIESPSLNPEHIIGESLNDDQYGIFAMSFQDLQKLIASVIEFSGSSAAAGANALAGIDSHQKEAMKPSPEQVKTLEKIQDVSKKLDTEDVTGIGADMEDAGMKNGNTSNIDVSKLKKHLMDQFKGDKEKVNAILVGLELENSNSEEEASAKSPLDVITDLSVEDQYKDVVIDIATEEELMDGEGEASPPNDPEAVDDVIEIVNDALDDDEQEELRDAFNSKNETVLRENINRWSKLAGIINE
jgi:hypothetical protein